MFSVCGGLLVVFLLRAAILVITQLFYVMLYNDVFRKSCNFLGPPWLVCLSVAFRTRKVVWNASSLYSIIYYEFVYSTVNHCRNEIGILKSIWVIGTQTGFFLLGLRPIWRHCDVKLFSLVQTPRTNLCTAIKSIT